MAVKAWSAAYLRTQHVVIDGANWEQQRPNSGEVDVLFVALHLHTMARARAVPHRGPGLLRTRDWPWGLPDVAGEARMALDSDNGLIRLAMSAIRDVSSNSKQPTILWVAPEDKGGRAASIWQLAELRQFALEGGWTRYSFNQCEVSDSRNQRPTAVLSFSPLRHPLLRKGWPRLRRDGDLYWGPLEHKCKCGRTHEPWSSQQRRPSTELEPGVVEWLMSVARDSGMARHLWKGKRLSSSARHPNSAPPHRTSRSASSPRSSRSPSCDSSSTCIPSPISETQEDAPLQWDDDAAIALGIPTRNRDRHTPHPHSINAIVKIVSENRMARGNETRRLRVAVALTGNLCAALRRGYALCAAHSVSMPRFMRCSQREHAMEDQVCLSYALSAVLRICLMRCSGIAVCLFMRCSRNRGYARMKLSRDRGEAQVMRNSGIAGCHHYTRPADLLVRKMGSAYRGGVLTLGSAESRGSPWFGVRGIAGEPIRMRWGPRNRGGAHAKRGGSARGTARERPPYALGGPRNRGTTAPLPFAYPRAGASTQMREAGGKVR